ncbi:replication factor C small subunit [Fadolivirus algeromassiliense]|jgi:replication factor C subunit 2/4|uniref:Replication factor C small subunit n=1 Tax=Fadolivirus FV1/VV64 TaxID=3070911 RepID=A0A7D3QVS3_9VIRU|nr:replication factor C small subunit [Fadolivirus algeromassiliense]QKF93859.1 replication factor C small subunit [Fadolivirus FV1/VV64]
MPRKSKYIDPDSENEENDDEEEEIIEAPKEEEEEIQEEMPHKKRGPKKRTIKRIPITSFTLENSDTESDTEDKHEIFQSQKQTIYYTETNRNTLNTPWIEKYRPVNVNDLVLEQNTLNKIKKYINDKNMPNIIITGSPGIGKTTTILCIAKNLLGKYFDQMVLELNASDDRGIKTVQESIEYFCKKKINIEDGYAQHKIILLDEADHLTKKAQQSINNLMEQYHETTRFAFTCNNSPEIIEAIQSRCTIFRYSRLTNEQMNIRLKKICEIEKVKYSEDGLNAIVTTAQGDLRQAINILQITHNGYIDVIPENVYKLCDKPHPLIITNIIISCSKKDIKTALRYLDDLRNKGYSSSDISLSMVSTIKNIDKDIINEAIKIKYMNEISKSCLVISKGMNTPLQLTGCIASLCRN